MRETKLTEDSVLWQMVWIILPQQWQSAQPSRGSGNQWVCTSIRLLRFVV